MSSTEGGDASVAASSGGGRRESDLDSVSVATTPNTFSAAGDPPPPLDADEEAAGANSGEEKVEVPRVSDQEGGGSGSSTSGSPAAAAGGAAAATRHSSSDESASFGGGRGWKRFTGGDRNSSQSSGAAAHSSSSSDERAGNNNNDTGAAQRRRLSKKLSKKLSSGGAASISGPFAAMAGALDDGGSSGNIDDLSSVPRSSDERPASSSGSDEAGHGHGTSLVPGSSGSEQKLKDAPRGGGGGRLHHHPAENPNRFVERVIRPVGQSLRHLGGAAFGHSDDSDSPDSGLSSDDGGGHMPTIMPRIVPAPVTVTSASGQSSRQNRPTMDGQRKTSMVAVSLETFGRRLSSAVLGTGQGGAARVAPGGQTVGGEAAVDGRGGLQKRPSVVGRKHFASILDDEDKIERRRSVGPMDSAALAGVIDECSLRSSSSSAQAANAGRKTKTNLLRRMCVVLAAGAAVACLILGAVLPNTDGGTAVRSAASQAMRTFEVAVSGRDHVEAEEAYIAAAVAAQNAAGSGGGRALNDPALRSGGTFGVPLLANGRGATTILPPHLYGPLADVRDPRDPDSSVDLPIVLALSAATGAAESGAGSGDGASALWDVLGDCLGAYVQTSSGESFIGGRSTEEDAQRQHHVPSAAGGQSLSARHVLFAPTLFDASAALSEHVRGRTFLLLRHPVKRAVSSYHELRDRAPQDAPIQFMDPVEYANSEIFVDNEAVRMLAGLGGGDDVRVDMGHVEIALEALRTRVLVGISEYLDESVLRFELYFGWQDADAPLLERQRRGDAAALRCRRERIEAGDRRREGAHPQPSPGSEEFRDLVRRNWADVQLYHAAKRIFREQAALVE